MQGDGYRVIALDEVPPVKDHGLDVDADWKPVRHHLGVAAFGMNAYVGDEEDKLVIEEHDESDICHQELYFVASGRAEFTLAGETIDAPAGTFVFIEDPDVRRKAVTKESGTTVLAIGAKPGEAFSPSEWETKRTATIERAA